MCAGKALDLQGNQRPSLLLLQQPTANAKPIPLCSRGGPSSLAGDGHLRQNKDTHE